MTEQPQLIPQPRPPLRRHSSDRVIGGVCGGLARTLGIDPVIVRVVVAVLALLGGAGIAAYVIAWVLIPDDEGHSALQDASSKRNRGTQFFLVLLVAIAAVAILDQAWPGLSGGLGFLVFVLVAVVAWQAFGSDWVSRTNVTAATPAAAPTSSLAPAADLPAVAPVVPAPAEPRSLLGRVVWNLLAVVVGAMIALDWTNVIDFTPRTMLAAALAVVGVGLLVSAFAGRARGLIALGLVLAVLTLPADYRGNGEVGDRAWVPVASSSGQPIEYGLGAGTATLDLTTLVRGAQTAGAQRLVIQVGAGDLTIVLPRDAAAMYEGELRVGVGEVVVDGDSVRDGLNLTLPMPGPDTPGSPVIDLDVQLGVGTVEVRYA